jgi:hypothetical protein
MIFNVLDFFENLSIKIQFHLNPTKITGTSHDDVSIFIKVSRWLLLRMRSVSSKRFGENKNTHQTFNTFFFENHATYEIMSKNVWEAKTTQMTIQSGACVLHVGQVCYTCVCTRTLARARVRAHPHTHTLTQARTHARAHHTQRNT